VYECDVETSIMGRPYPARGLLRHDKKIYEFIVRKQSARLISICCNRESHNEWQSFIPYVVSHADQYMSAEIYIVLGYDRNVGICRERRENSYLLHANICVIAFAWERFSVSCCL